MSINPYGLIRIKNADGVTWNPAANLLVKTTATNWTPVKTGWIKYSDGNWYRVYPTTFATPIFSTSSLSFIPYVNYTSLPQTITVVNTSPNPLVIRGVLTSNGATYTTTIDYTGFGGGVPITLSSNQSASISLTVKGVSAGSSTGNIVFVNDVGFGKFANTTIPLTANVQPDYNGISVFPPTLTFSYNSSDTLPQANVTISNQGNGDSLNIISVTSDGNTIVSNVSTAPIGFFFGNLVNQTTTFTIKANVTAVGTTTTPVLITSNSSSNSLLQIPVTMTVSNPVPMQTVYTPGTYNFVVPNYLSTLKVEVWGGGAGGNGGYQSYAPGAGGTSTWYGNVIATGGSGTVGGSASGGDTNSAGTSASGGTGGTAPSGSIAGGQGAYPGNNTYGGQNGGAGGIPGGGAGGAFSFVAGGVGGGSGAYTVKTYTLGQLTPGTIIPVIVGKGGSGGVAIANQGEWSGGAGGDGQVIITWTQTGTSS